MSPIVVVRDIAYEFSDGRELFKHLSFSLGAARSALVGRRRNVDWAAASESQFVSAHQSPLAADAAGSARAAEQ